MSPGGVRREWRRRWRAQEAMNCDAGHFKNPGALARLKSNDANVGGGDWHRGTRVMTADAWPSPSQVGEDEVARDEVMRSGSVEAWRRQGPRGNRPSRWMRRGRGSLRRRARDAPSGRRRGTRDGHLYVGTANVWRQWRAQRVHCTPGLGAAATRERKPSLEWAPGTHRARCAGSSVADSR